MKNNNFKENFFPAIVLVTICLVVTLALAGTYSVANPKIEANAKKAADEARVEVLAAVEDSGFTAYDGKLVSGVKECYMANNKAGMAVTSEYKGFGGAVEVMIGIDAEGGVTGVKITNHAETPGLGTKAMDPGYLKQYMGVKEASAGHIKDDANVHAVTGATITSNAVYNSIGEALAQFAECGGVK